jgi:4-cresol dehydrogenase (hydroxylating)
MLPPNVTSDAFAAALGAFEKVVGKDWVFSRDEDIALYRDAYSPFWGEKEERVASAAVAPESAEQVQAIVKVANQYHIPLYPISTGKNLGYGGSAPTYSGSVVLDLKRMNKILEINEKLFYILVEPDVSFFDVYHALQQRGIKLAISMPAPGWGSPIGNALEHGTGTLGRDHFGTHCGMEVVLGSGEILRTGMGAMPNSQLWQTYNYGFGPFINGMFSQSNFGVVTKMGFNLVPEPEVARTLMVSSWNFDDLDPFVEAAAFVEQIGVSRFGAGIGSPLMSTPNDPDIVALIKRTGNKAAASELNRLASDKKRPVFSSMMRFHGPTKIVDAQIEYVKDRFGSIAGTTFSEGKSFKFPMSHAEIEDNAKEAFGIPSLATFAVVAMVGHTGHFFFSPNIPMTGEAIRKSNQIFQATCEQLGTYWGWAPLANIFPKTLTVIKDFDATKDVAVNRRNREVFLRLIEVAGEHGWSEYRTPAGFQDAVMNEFSFNNHALLRFHETLKDAVDPNGILSAGRAGIWPKHLRGKHA